MKIKIDKIERPQDLMSVWEMIDTRISDTEAFEVNLENVSHMNLANFNALVKLYVKLNRMGKRLIYVNCHSERVRELVHKTQLNNVFITE